MITSFLPTLLSVPVAYAQLDLPGVVQPVASGGTVITFVCTVVFKWIFTGIIFLSIALALYAAFNYMTAAGEPAKVTKANKTLMFVAAGIVVAILARTFPIVVGSLVAGDLKLDPCAPTQTGPTPPGT